MVAYYNRGGNSGVSSYEEGSDRIVVRFNDGAEYLYTNGVTGAHNIEQMKALARKGIGLNSFINTRVRKGYAAKLH